MSEIDEKELRELEALENELSDEEGDQNKEHSDEEELDMDDLEKELHAMEDGEPNNQSKKSNQPKPQAQCKMPLDAIEKEFHGMGLFFSDLIDMELNQIIPILKKKYEKDENAMDLLIYLNKKECDLLNFKSDILKKVEAGDIDEEKYIGILKKILDANKKTLERAKQINLDKLNIGRIEKRISNLQNEINGINSEIDNDTAEVNNKGKQDIKQPNKTESNIVKQKDRDQSNINKKEEEEEDEDDDNVNSADLNDLDELEEEMNNPKKKEVIQPPIKKVEIIQDTKIAEPRVTGFSSNPAVLHLASKISLFISIADYIKKEFGEERISDVNHVYGEIEKMKIFLEKIKKEKNTVKIESIDKAYPSLKLDFILGISLEERGQKIKEIAEGIKNDLEDIKKNNKRMFPIYDKYYNEFFQKLKLIKEKTNIPFPKIERKDVAFNYKEINTEIDRGSIILKIDNIKVFKSHRFYFLKCELEYEGKKYNFQTPYCENGGRFNQQHVFNLENTRLKNKLAQCKMKFRLYKRKMLITSRLISEVESSLEKVLHYANFNQTLSFNYKNGKKLLVDISYSIHNGLSNTYLVDLKLYTIVKLYPPFEPPKSIKQQTQAQTQSQTQKQENQAPSLKPDPKNVPKVDSKIHVKKKDDVDSIEKAKFKYPLLSPQEKNGLKNIITKYKLPAGYIDYQEKIFCVSFLEEFSNELETQITAFNLKGDFAMAKEANSIFANANKYMNYFSSKLEDGSMTPQQYKDIIDNFIKVDETQLEFFTKIKFEKSVTFISNRLKLMKKESNDLTQMIEQE